MTEQDRHQSGSLADGLANWTPPWARRPQTDHTPDTAAPHTTADADTDAPTSQDETAHEVARTDAEPVTTESADDTTPTSGTSSAVTASNTASSDTVSTTDPVSEPAGTNRVDEPIDAAEPSGEVFAAGTVPTDATSDASEASNDVSTPHTDGAEHPVDQDFPTTAEESTTDAVDRDGPDQSHDAVTPEADADSHTDTDAVEPGPPADLRGALEAILLVVDEPVAEVVLAQILEQPTEQITATLQELADEYTRTGRGFDLRRAAGGWRLYTRSEFAPYVERFVLDGQQVRLTQAALETLAVVAYKQPVTRSRVSAIRGVNCDGVIRTLLTRGLIEECGTEPDTGAHLYRTTTLFCEKLGIDSVDDLPPLAPFLPDDVPQDLTDEVDRERTSRGGAPAATTDEPEPATEENGV